MIRAADAGRPRRWLRSVGLLFLLSGCGTQMVRGEFSGSTYINKTAGYSFSIPAGWRSDHRYLAQLEQQTGQASSIEFALRGRSDSLIVGAATRSWAVISLSPPGPIADTEKVQFLKKWFPELPAPEYSRLSVSITDFGPNTFALVTGPQVCSVLERARAMTTNRSWDRFAVMRSHGYMYQFFGNICDPESGDSFETLLASIRLLK